MPADRACRLIGATDHGRFHSRYTSPRFQTLRSIGAGSQHLLFARDFVELLDVHRPDVRSDLRWMVARELLRRSQEWAGLDARSQVALRYSGLESDVSARVKQEQTSWELLCDGLADLVAAHASSVVDGNPSRLGLRGGIPVSAARLDEVCPYYGMTQARRVVDLAERRYITVCYGCGMRADAPAELNEIVLEGPASFARGETYTCAVRCNVASTSGPHYVAARLVIESGLLLEGAEGSAWHSWMEGSDLSVPLCLTTHPRAAPGLYVIVVALVVDGLLAYGRRPVFQRS
jgi:hypothetical protein